MNINFNQPVDIKSKLSKFAITYKKDFEGKIFYFHGYNKEHENKKIEVFFSKKNFHHLTGNAKPEEFKGVFYKNCIKGSLKNDEYQFKEDSTSKLKLAVMDQFDLLIKEKLYFGECMQSGVYLSNDLCCAVGKRNIVLGLGNSNPEKDKYYPLTLLNGNVENYVEPVYEVYKIESKKIWEEEKEFNTIMINQKIMDKAKNKKTNFRSR